MTVNKTSTGKWRARVKSKGNVVADQTFKLKHDADTWEAAQKRKLILGEFVDPKAGREPLGNLIDRWLESREGTVASKTHQNDRASLGKRVSASLRRRPIGSITAAELDSLLGTMLRSGLARSSVVRFRATLSAMFSWAVLSKLISRNPLDGVKVPTGLATNEAHEIYPFSLAEFRELIVRLGKINSEQAEIAHVLGLTGIRWGELCALRVRDVQAVPRMSFLVARSAPDGHATRNVTKGGVARSVPLPPELIDIVARRMEGKTSQELLFSSPNGKPLNGNNWKRGMKWAELGLGRRVHDLRHTAATLWLTNGLDPKVVQSWLGHSSLTLTVDLYGHWMGNDADAAALAKFTNVLGDASGTRARKLRTSTSET
jgi:integrase